MISSGTTSYSNDHRGNVTKVVDSSGRAISYTVNALDLVEAEQSPTGQKTYKYDASANMVEASAQSAVAADGKPVFVTTRYEYDALRTITAVAAPEGVTSYGFDNAHNLQSVSKPDGKVVSYQFDARNRIVTKNSGGATETYSYDDDNDRASTTSPQGKKISYLFDGFGRMTGSTNPAGLTTETGLDSAGRPIDTKVIGPDNKLYRWTASSYDPVTRTQTEIAKLFSQPIALNPDGSIPEGAPISDVVKRWTFDGDGNVIAYEDPLHRIATNQYANGRLVKSTDPAGNTIEYTYDAAGNRSVVKETDVTTRRPGAIGFPDLDDVR